MVNKNDKLVSILSYFLIGFILLLIDKKNQNKITLFHAKQALNLMIISTIIKILLVIIIMLSSGMLVFLMIILKLVILVFWILGLMNAINLNQKEIPFIGSFANKYLKF